MSHIFPEEPFTVQCWVPTEEKLKNSVVVVVGYNATGKTTLIRSFESETLQVDELQGRFPIPDGNVLHVGSFQSFLDIQPTDRGNIDFLIFCGLPSRRDVERIFERYEHLLSVNFKEFYEITQRFIGHYQCLVLDISQMVRLGSEKGKFYFYRAQVAK